MRHERMLLVQLGSRESGAAMNPRALTGLIILSMGAGVAAWHAIGLVLPPRDIETAFVAGLGMMAIGALIMMDRKGRGDS